MFALFALPTQAGAGGGRCFSTIEEAILSVADTGPLSDRRSSVPPEPPRWPIAHAELDELIAETVIGHEPKDRPSYPNGSDVVSESISKQYRWMMALPEGPAKDVARVKFAENLRSDLKEKLGHDSSHMLSADVVAEIKTIDTILQGPEGENIKKAIQECDSNESCELRVAAQVIAQVEPPAEHAAAAPTDHAAEALPAKPTDVAALDGEDDDVVIPLTRRKASAAGEPAPPVDEDDDVVIPLTRLKASAAATPENPHEARTVTYPVVHTDDSGPPTRGQGKEVDDLLASAPSDPDDNIPLLLKRRRTPKPATQPAPAAPAVPRVPPPTPITVPYPVGFDDPTRPYLPGFNPRDPQADVVGTRLTSQDIPPERPTLVDLDQVGQDYKTVRFKMLTAGGTWCCREIPPNEALIWSKSWKQMSKEEKLSYLMLTTKPDAKSPSRYPYATGDIFKITPDVPGAKYVRPAHFNIDQPVDIGSFAVHVGDHADVLKIAMDEKGYTERGWVATQVSLSDPKQELDSRVYVVHPPVPDSVPEEARSEWINQHRIDYIKTRAVPKDAPPSRIKEVRDRAFQEAVVDQLMRKAAENFAYTDPKTGVTTHPFDVLPEDFSKTARGYTSTPPSETLITGTMINDAVYQLIDPRTDLLRPRSKWDPKAVQTLVDAGFAPSADRFFAPNVRKAEIQVALVQQFLRETHVDVIKQEVNNGVAVVGTVVVGAERQQKFVPEGFNNTRGRNLYWDNKTMRWQWVDK